MQGVCCFVFLPCARVHVPSYHGLPALPWTMAPALTGWLCVEVPGTGVVSTATYYTLQRHVCVPEAVRALTLL